MKKVRFISAVAAVGMTALSSMPAHAADKMDCEKLKQSIEEKMTSHGVKNFKLDVVDAAQAGDGKVVGSCDGGAHKIVYSKDAAAASK
jgi:hypothetical protein